MVECWLRSLIDTRATLYCHLSWHLIDISVNNMWINTDEWVDTRSTMCQLSVSRVSIEMLIEGQWRIQGSKGQWRINTLLQMPSQHMNHQVVCTVKAYHSFHNMRHLQLVVWGNFCFLRWIITNEWHGINVRTNEMLIKWVHFLQVAGYMVLYQEATNTHYQKKSGEWVCEQLCQSDMLRWGSLSAVRI